MEPNNQDVHLKRVHFALNGMSKPIDMEIRAGEGWYYWNAERTERFGPFGSEDEAQTACDAHVTPKKAK